MNKMNQKWEKPEIEHGKMTKYNYIVQYPENLTTGINFDIGEFTFKLILCSARYFNLLILG